MTGFFAQDDPTADGVAIGAVSPVATRLPRQTFTLIAPATIWIAGRFAAKVEDI